MVNLEQRTGDGVGGDKIIVGNIQSSYAAIGAGAQVIVNQTISRAQELDLQHQVAEHYLAGAIQRKVERYARLVDAHPTNGAAGRNPYKALLNYGIEDAPIFYGRAEAIHKLLNAIHTSRLTVLHAESGAGKTSLLEAGIAARLLTEGYLPLLVRSHQRAPALAIKQSLLPGLEGDKLLDLFVNQNLVAFLNGVYEMLGRRTLYIFLDQFEEFFTELEPRQQQDFAEDLGNCLQEPGLNVRWVLSLRKEYFSDLRKLYPYVAQPFANEVRLEAFSDSQAVSIMCESAGSRGIQYQAGLPEKVVQDLQDNRLYAEARLGQASIFPPHLQIVCYALVDNLPESETLLTHQMYQTLGLAQGILRNHLNVVVNHHLPGELGKRAMLVLGALISSDNRRVVRAQSTLLEMLMSESVSERDLETILTELVQSRLVRRSQHEQGYAYELAHDYLAAEIQHSPEAKARKAALELLERELANWRACQALMRPETLRVVATQRHTNLALSSEACLLLVKSAFEHDDDLAAWLAYVPANLAQQILLEGLDHPDADGRLRAAEHIGDYYTPTAADKLATMAANDASAPVRDMALRSLALTELQRVQHILLDELRHPPPLRRQHAAQGLAAYLDQPAADALFACVISDPEPIVWQAALNTLASDAARPFRAKWKPLSRLPFARQAQVWEQARRQGIAFPLGLRARLWPARALTGLKRQAIDHSLRSALLAGLGLVLYMLLAWRQGYPPFVRWSRVPHTPPEAMSQIVLSPKSIYVVSMDHGLGFLDPQNDNAWKGWISGTLPIGTVSGQLDDPSSVVVFIEKMVVNPQNPAQLYIYIRERGLMKSNDEGQHWQNVSVPPTLPISATGLMLDLDVWGDFVLLAAGQYGLLVSTDAGESWEKYEAVAGTSVFYTMARFGPQGQPYLSTDQALYRGSTSDWTAWEKILARPVSEMAFGPDGWIYLAIGSVSTSMTCLTDKNLPGTQLDFGNPVLAIAPHPNKPGTFYVLAENETQEVTCTNKRRSLSSVPLESATDLAMSKETGYLYQTTYGGLYLLRP